MTLPTFTAAERAALEKRREFDRNVLDDGFLSASVERTISAEHTALTKLLAWLDQQDATDG